MRLAGTFNMIRQRFKFLRYRRLKKFCRRLVEDIFSQGWQQVKSKLIQVAVLQIQTSFRAHVHRASRKLEFKKLNANLANFRQINATLLI